MSLLTPVLVRGINNLSDARYCAGMGADGLIFTLDPTLPGALAPAEARELAGWVAGVRLIGEFGALPEAEEINHFVTECGLHEVLRPAAAELSDSGAAGLSVPRLVVMELTDDSLLASLQQQLEPLRQAAGIVLTWRGTEPFPQASWPVLGGLASHFPLWLDVAGLPAATVPALLAAVQPAGLVLPGGDELKPGLRDFAALDELFELLESD